MMPGMAANSKIFDFISLPENFNIHYLEWEMPIGDESIQEYSSRISKKIKGKNIVLIGVSFGGIVVQEISKFIKTHKIIIISSIKTKNELPLMMQLGRKTKAYKFFNVKWIFLLIGYLSNYSDKRYNDDDWKSKCGFRVSKFLLQILRSLGDISEFAFIFENKREGWSQRT